MKRNAEGEEIDNKKNIRRTTVIIINGRDEGQKIRLMENQLTDSRSPGTIVEFGDYSFFFFFFLNILILSSNFVFSSPLYVSTLSLLVQSESKAELVPIFVFSGQSTHRRNTLQSFLIWSTYHDLNLLISFRGKESKYCNFLNNQSKMA